MKSIACVLLFVHALCAFGQQPGTIPPGYTVRTIATPPGEYFGVAGLAVARNGDVYAGTRYGEVWRYSREKWTLFGDGLHEIAGLAIDPVTQEILIAQKPELTRLIDDDSDGRADVYETVSDDWGFTGNYHEFSFGPVRDSMGNLYGTLNLSHGQGPAVGGGIMTMGAPGRGTCYRITPDGKYSTFAWGMRSPAGIGINPVNDEIFYTDNQGDWNSSSSLHQVIEGRFYGHPCSLLYHPDYVNTDLNALTPGDYDLMREQPIVWIPHGEMASSPGNPVFDSTQGGFGVFTGQIFVGDQTRSNIFRCVLEKVGDRYQGACIEFINHLQSGAVRLAFAPDGSLWVGETSRGWGSVGSAPFGVEQIVYDGETVPFEILSVNLTRTGFDMTFTVPVDADQILNADTCRINHWAYLYSGKYGSPKIDETQVKTPMLSLSGDRRTLSVSISDLQTARVYMLEMHRDFKSESGQSLTNRRAYYTLNRLR